MILPYLKAGGTERQASYISNYLSNNGHQTDIISIENEPAFEYLFDNSVTYLNSKNSFIYLIKNIFLIINKIKSYETDVIISRAWNSNFISIIVSIITRKPVVVFLSGSIDLSGSSSVKRFIQSCLINKAAKIISVSEKSKKNCMKWLNVPEEKIKIIYNGVDTDLLNKLANEPVDIPEELNQDSFKIVFVGRLIHRKGLDVLLNAIAKMNGNRNNVTLSIIGSGPEQEKYQQQADTLNIRNKVFFLGEKSNPFPYIKYGDIFVMPSRSEGFPNVLLEAMALKKPVISSDCESGPNEILNDKNGILFPVGDSALLKQAIEEFLDYPNLKKEYAEKAYQTVISKFNLNHQLKVLEDELKNINQV